jgi:hypothetical protein
MTEHLHELEGRPSRTTMEVIAFVLGRLDSYHHTSLEDRARRFAALLSLEGRQVVEAIPMPAERAIR